MNTKNNQLSRATSEKIVRAVFQQIAEKRKPVSRITVREICEETGINRSTFYAHFQDIYDVVEKVELRMSEMLTSSLMDTLEQTGSLRKLFEQLFYFVQDYKKFYEIYFQEMHQASVIGIAWDMIDAQTSSIDYQQFGFKNPDEVEYAGAFFISGLTAMVRMWLEKGCKETPAELVDVLTRQFRLPPSLTELI